MKKWLNESVANALRNILYSKNVIIKYRVLNGKFIVYSLDGKKAFTIKEKKCLESVRDGNWIHCYSRKYYIEIDGIKYKTYGFDDIYETVLALYKKQTEKSTLAFLSQIQSNVRK